MNIDQAAKKLQKYSKHIVLLEYTHSKLPAKFKDLRDGDIFTYSYTNVLTACKKDPEYKYGKVSRSKIEYVKKLKKYAPDLTLLEYVPRGYSTFFDASRDLEFSYLTTKLLHKKKVNPSFIPRPTKEQRSEIAKKARRSQGNYIEFSDGSTPSVIAERVGRSSHNIIELYNKGYTKDQLLSLRPNITSIEVIIKEELDRLGISYVFNRKLEDCGRRPDFYIPKHNLVIECDGLYYHSDIYKSNSYHINKKKDYTDYNYTSIFFRQDELLLKKDICVNILKNTIGVTEERVFARKCSVEKISSSFFDVNHLMGKGSGKCYGLVYNGEIVAGMQTRYISSGFIDISRFCTKLGVSVPGGFTKLLTAAEKDYKPERVRTFIDLRYGSGSYLGSLGFSLETTYKSFKWTDGTKTYHRMKYPSNTGYDHGLYKIWDCGQAKWIKHLDRGNI